MAGSTIGTLFRITTWGESHGPAIGVTIDGCPAGLPLTEEDIQAFLDRRKPGQNKFTTARKESDKAVILSGVFEGTTTGTPITIAVFNEDQRSKDYSNIMNVYRPGHADYTFHQKYGIRDYRGGGRSSGRETIGRVAAGAIASKLLNTMGIKLTTYCKAIGSISVPDEEIKISEIRENPLNMPNNAYAKEASKYLEACISEQNSSGGMIECKVDGVPVGLGETVFDKLDADLAKAIMSIGSVKGVEIGDGFDVVTSTGRTNNDPFAMEEEKVVKKTNHSGGILGGMSDGSQIILRAAVKPTPSISREQATVNKSNENEIIAIHGRHDPIIAPRAVVVVESMVAITILDHLMRNMTAKVDSLKTFYDR